MIHQLLTRSGHTRALLLLAALAALVPSTEPAAAATVPATLTNQAQVIATCNMVISTSLNFPAYDINDPAPLSASGTFDVTCSQGAPIYITISQGLHPAAGSTDTNPIRQLSAGGVDRMDYGLYLDAAYTMPWGNTFGTGATLTGSGGNNSVQLFALIPDGQIVMSGTYTDQVTALVTY